METEIINTAKSALSTGESLGGGGILGALSVVAIAWIKNAYNNRSDKAVVANQPVLTNLTSDQIELRLRKYLSEVIVNAVTKLTDKMVLSNEEIAESFISHLEASTEKQAVTNESFKNVYKKIEDESKKYNSRVDHVQENWVHKDRLKDALAIKKDIG